MYVCMYICMYVCVCTCVCARGVEGEYAFGRSLVPCGMNVCMHVYMRYACIHELLINASFPFGVDAESMCGRCWDPYGMDVCMHVYIHESLARMRARAHTHTHTHTHTHRPASYHSAVPPTSLSLLYEKNWAPSPVSLKVSDGDSFGGILATYTVPPTGTDAVKVMPSVMVFCAPLIVVDSRMSTVKVSRGWIVAACE
jgi:hypothetical protein